MARLERLIALVREYPALYNSSHDDYSKTKLKDEMWREIAQELNSTGDATKEQWRKLRDCHRDALRRQKRKLSIDANTPLKTWMYQKQMEFLLPYGNNSRPVSSNVLEEAGKNEEDEEELKGYDIELAKCEWPYTQLDDGEASVSSMERKRFKPDMNFMVEAVDHPKLSGDRDNLTHHQQMKENDALYDFFMSMYKSTRVMTPLLQLQVKRALFHAVSEAEDAMMSIPELKSFPSYDF